MKVTMQTKWTAQAICQACGGVLLGNSDVMAFGLCTDSREADESTVFVAMRGERVNGHDYIGAARANGCRIVLCEAPSNETGLTHIIVDDSEAALLRLAAAYRETLTCKAVGVTGSVGKTTTKEMIASVLSVRSSVYRSEGNHNSVIGMPLSVMEIDRDHTYAVLEMGMSGLGEIERMSDCATPDIAVITNIGTSHMEMLGSRENICRAKLEILSGLRKGGVLICNGDEPLLSGIGGKDYRTITVSIFSEKASLYAKNIRIEDDGTYFDAVWEGRTYPDMHVRVQGRHNVYAALYAFAVGMVEGFSAEEIRAGLLEFSSVGMRQNIYTYRGFTVIEDCYNASPESMRAALDVLVGCARRAGGKSVAVLGEMLELGTQSDNLHRAVGAYAAECGVDLLLTLGHGSEMIAKGAIEAGLSSEHIDVNNDIENVSHTAESLLRMAQSGDVILFKASRSIRMERVLACWKLQFEER